MEVSAVKVTRDKQAVTYPSSKNQKWKDDQITIPMEDIEALSEGGKAHHIPYCTKQRSLMVYNNCKKERLL